MILKAGVKLTDLKPQLVIAIIVANDIYKEFNKELVITSVDDSVHSNNSLHYTGYAFDCRTKYFYEYEITHVVNKIKERLGAEFDVIFEKDHIHIEYDPK